MLKKRAKEGEEMLGRMDGLKIKKNTIVNVLTLGIFVGLFMGGFTFIGGNDNKEEGTHETGRGYEVVGLEKVEGVIEDSLLSESDLIEAFLSGLEKEQRQDAVEILDGWLENNLDASPELRAAIESVLDEQREVLNGESLENNTFNSISNGNNTNNNDDRTGNNSQDGNTSDKNDSTGNNSQGGNTSNNNNSTSNNSLNDTTTNNNNNTNNNSQSGNTSNASNNDSSGNNGNHHPPRTGGDGNIMGPSSVCENPYWVANTRPVFMLGTPGFWISRHRCIFCGFATTCIGEALAHLSGYEYGSSYCEPPWPTNCELGCCDQIVQLPPNPPNPSWWIMVYEPYYEFNDEVPGEIIYLPDGTYTCMNCGRIKDRGFSSE